MKTAMTTQDARFARPHRGVARLLVGTAICAISLLVSGCASSKHSADPDAQIEPTSTVHASPDVVEQIDDPATDSTGKSTDKGDPITVTQAYPPEDHTQAIIHTENGNETPGERITQMGAGDARTVIMRYDNDVPGSTVSLDLNADGDLVMTKLEAEDDGKTRILGFDPPLVVMRAEMAPGDVVEAKSKVTTADGSRDRGTATRRAEHTGIDAKGRHTLAVTLVIKLGPAKATTTFEQTIDPELGLMGETIEQKVRVLGFPVESKTSSWRLADDRTPDE